MLMFNSLIDGEWLSDGGRAPNVNPSDTKDIVGEAVRGTRAQAEAAGGDAALRLPESHQAGDRGGRAGGRHAG